MDFVGTAVSAVKVALQIKKYFDEIQEVDDRIQDIVLELDSLAEVLESISKCTIDTSESLFGLDRHRQVLVTTRLMEKCTNTLERLRRIVERICQNTLNNPFLRRSKMKLELDNRSDDINRCREQITGCRQTLQLSLQAITLYVSKAR